MDALLPRPPGVKQESRRLCPAVEAIVAEEIQRFHRTRQRPAVAELVERIHALSMGLASKRASTKGRPEERPRIGRLSAKRTMRMRLNAGQEERTPGD